jgi:hypothetical protein
VSALYEQKRIELLADLKDRVKVDGGVHPTKGKLKFAVLNAKKGTDSLLAAIGLSYENSVQIILDATLDGRIFTKEPGYYDNINRRLYMVNGGEGFVKQQIILILNHYLALPNDDSFSWSTTLLSGMDSVRNAAIADAKLKSDYQQKCVDHKLKAPYLADIGAEPNTEVELLSWNERLTEWEKTHQTEFTQWESEKVDLSRNYDNEHFMLIYNAILSRMNRTPENVIPFIKEDFARLFKDNFVEIDPLDTFQSMAYVTLLFNFKACNLSCWNLIPDTSDLESDVKISTDWKYTLSPLAYDINVLRTVDEDGHAHYLKLVNTNDTAGLMRAIRSERALGLPKITKLPVNTPSV